MRDGIYPEGLMRCGAPHGAQVCGQFLLVELGLLENATFTCDRGHRLGDVGEVDAYLMAVVLGSVSRQAIHQRFGLMIPGGLAELTTRALADWWDDASPRERYALITTVIDRVDVVPASIPSAPPVTVHWKDDPVVGAA